MAIHIVKVLYAYPKMVIYPFKEMRIVGVDNRNERRVRVNYTKENKVKIDV